MKKYLTPTIDHVSLCDTDVITTSDIEAGVETVPLPEGDGTWEIL